MNSPGPSFVAVLTLAVGLASSAALFSVYDRLVLNFVAVPNPSSLVAIWSSNPQVNFNGPAVSWPRFQEVRKSAKSFSSMGVSAFDNFTLTGNGEQPDQLNGLRVSGAFFRTLGIPPARGRDFSDADDTPNGPTVCIISHELWMSHFGGRESVLGEKIQLNGLPWQVVGIMPPHLTPPFAQVQVFAPRVFEINGLTAPQIEAGAGYAQPIARLARGVSFEQARLELAALSAQYAEHFGTRLDGKNLSLPLDFGDSLVQNLKPTFYTLLGAVAFVLVIACANVSNLFLGRLTARQTEIAVRQSLGASRADIIRQFLTESLVLSGTGAFLGALLSKFSLTGIQRALASQTPPNTEFSMNWRVSLVLIGAAIISAVIVGLIPSLQASKTQLVNTLKEAGRGSASSKGGRWRSSLVIAEVALSVMLLVGSGLLLMSFLSLQRTPPGFDPKGLATAFVGVPLTRYPTLQVQADFFARVVDRLKGMPQVTAAGASLALPIQGFGARSPYSVQGRTILPLPQRPLAGLQVASEGYFSMMRIPIVQGRAFTKDDRDGAPGVCVINQQLADRLFPNESPLGHVMLRGRDANIGATIVGVSANVKSAGLSAPVPDEIYYPMRQLGKPGMSVTVRTDGDPNLMQSVIRQAVAEEDRDQPISFFQTIDTAVAQSLGNQRIVAWVTVAFAAIAILLSAIGLYAVVAYAVGQRTGEIGLRMALGAQPSQVLRLIMTGGLKLVSAGLVLGLAGAAGTAKLIQSLLSNVQPLDPMVFSVSAVFFGLVAALACLIPSMRASRIDPLIALGGVQAARRARRAV